MGYVGEQRRAYQKKWLAARRAAWFADKCCVICGVSEDLEIDHIDPSTKDQILKGKLGGAKGGTGAIWSWAEGRRERELAKCQVLCCDHHKEKTAQQRRERMVHGISMYKKADCRCDVCRLANRDYARERRRREREGT